MDQLNPVFVAEGGNHHCGQGRAANHGARQAFSHAAGFFQR
eukprot:CAMPEP_0197253578 /NCGR_PEP_ID=MMETSP1429-20130617/65660_1 /TAXON_ID=49237 /ORGANISM="Chaetoceros  sp., Strain UNC1202" /LENGTH=40 /DNA_ID= /DNA_START= /DNA_END= /DNA_ORIENTATION=